MEKSPIYKLEDKLINRRNSYFQTRRYSVIFVLLSLSGVVALFTNAHPDINEMISSAINTTIFFSVVAYYSHIRIQHIESILFYRKALNVDN